MVEYALLDMYHLIVEVLFGHFLLAVIGIAALFAVICFILKMSTFLGLTISMLYLCIMMIGYSGSIVGIFLFFFSSTFFAYSMIRWIQGYLSS